MMISKTAKVSQSPITRPAFRIVCLACLQIVCVNCDSLGIVFDYPEGAPPSTRSNAGTAGDSARNARRAARFLVQIDGICFRSEPVPRVWNRREAGVGYQIVSGCPVISVPWFSTLNFFVQSHRCMSDVHSAETRIQGRND